MENQTEALILHSKEMNHRPEHLQLEILVVAAQNTELQSILKQPGTNTKLKASTSKKIKNEFISQRNFNTRPNYTK